MDTRTVYFICDNGSVYTSDKSDLKGEALFSSSQFQADFMFSSPEDNTPYLAISGLSSVNPDAKTLKNYNGFLYNTDNYSIKMTISFPNIHSAQTTISNLADHLVFISIATDKTKQHVYTKRAMLVSADRTDGEYVNGVQYDIEIAVNDFWTGSAFTDGQSGSSITIPAGGSNSRLSKWNGSGDIPGDCTPNTFGIQIAYPSGQFTIKVSNENYNVSLNLNLSGYPAGTSDSIFIASDGLVYRKDHEDLIGIDTYLKDIGYNLTPAVSDFLGQRASIRLGGMNLGNFVVNPGQNDQVYALFLQALKATETQNTTISVSNATIQAGAYLEYKPFI